jgi:DNA-binding NarL/FixJ family response regulator
VSLLRALGDVDASRKPPGAGLVERRRLRRRPEDGQRRLTRLGYLLKDRVSDIAVLADALKRIDEGECVIDPTIVSRLLKRPREQGPLDELTEREREVLGLMAEGRSNGAICQTLFLSPKTVEANVRQIFRKLGLQQSPDDHRRVLAVLAYLRAGPAD